MIYFFVCGCIALFILAVCFLIHIFSLKKEMRKMKDELRLTKDIHYNRVLKISLIDKDLSELAAEINNNLDFQKQLKFQSERAEQRLKESVSDIAHDLRTPLTVIKGNLKLIENGGGLSERDMGYIRICFERCDTMKAMADDFFELSVLESDTTPVKLERINATNLLMEFIVENEAVIREHNLTPDIIFPEKSVFISADETMFIRILGNLLNNVVKYANDSFIIKLEEGKEGKCKLIFSNFVGKERNIDTERLFDRTYRADKARTGGGAGLGLYIVKLLAEKQGASVKAEIKEDMLCMSVIFDESKMSD